MAKRTKNLIESTQTDGETRVNKYLSDAGICSRREADKHIEEGKVTINGVTAVMGSKVKAGDKVMLEGKPVDKDEALVLIAFHKPRGIVCTTDKREKDNIIDFIQYNKRIYPIGRLDKESEGLILLTNDGDIVNKILRAGNNHEKEYVVTVNKPLTAEFLNGMAAGVPILDTVTRPCTVKAMDRFTFQIILTQGLNRQIRRMCEYYDYKVLTLKRTRIMNVNLGYLQLGGYRNVTDKEIAGLNELISSSINTPETIWNSMEDASDEDRDLSISQKRVKNNYNTKKTPGKGSFQRDKYSIKDKATIKDKANIKDKAGKDSKGTDSKATRKNISLNDNTDRRHKTEINEKTTISNKNNTNGRVSDNSKTTIKDKSGTKERAAFHDKSGMKGRTAYSDRPGSKDRTTYKDKSDSKDGTTYKDKSGSKERTTFKAKPGFKDRTTYKDKSDSKDRTTYKDKSGFKDRTTYKDKSDSKDRTTYKDKPGFKERTTFKDKPEFKEKTTYKDKSGSKNGTTYKDKSGSKDRTTFRVKPGFKDRTTFKDKAGFKDKTTFRNKSGFDDKTAYNGETDTKDKPAIKDKSGRTAYENGRKKSNPGKKSENHSYSKPDYKKTYKRSR